LPFSAGIKSTSCCKKGRGSFRALRPFLLPTAHLFPHVPQVRQFALFGKSGMKANTGSVMTDHPCAIIRSASLRTSASSSAAYFPGDSCLIQTSI
jgi:hypothetical protein